MGRIGQKIVQSRIWIDPTAPKPPNLNYEETFPITVFDAVRKEMGNVDSPTLTEVIDRLSKEIESRQPKFPAKPSNFLMTFAGVPGGVGAIQISREIPWDPSSQRHDRIPTEKAVGEFFLKLGLTDESGNIIDPGSMRVRWSDIIGRPLIYDSLGNNEDGVMTQKAVTQEIIKIRSDVEYISSSFTGQIDLAIKDISDHVNNKDNPHEVTCKQIGALSREELDYHVNEAINPHNITADMIGLGNVDNTSDLDKPISAATEEAINAINDLISNMNSDITDLNFITDITYNQSSGSLTVTYRNGSNMSLFIPIDGLVDELQYDKETKELVVIELSGHTTRINLAELFIRYIGSVSPNITVEIINAENDGWIEISKPKVESNWSNKGAGSIDADDNEINNEKVIYNWDNNGEGSTANDKGEISKPKVDYHWDMDGNGDVSYDPDEPNLGDNINEDQPTGIQIIKATINPESITSMEMADGAIITRVLRNQSVTGEKIHDLTITTKKYADESITTEKVAKHAITNTRIADRAVNGRTLFSSPIDNRVLATLEAGSDPVWTKVTAPMMDSNSIQTAHLINRSVSSDKLMNQSVITNKIADKAVTREKIADNAVVNDNIVNGTISGQKLVSSPIFNGTPKINTRPAADVSNNEIPDTRWVQDKIRTMVIDHSNLGERIVNGHNLFSSNVRNRALVTFRAGSDPVWGLINHDMMDNNSIDNNNLIDLSVTKEKIRDKSIETRHMTTDAIQTDHINDDAITSNKIWKSDSANRVLASLVDNGNPVYSQVTRPMIEYNAISSMQIEDRSVTLSKLETSSESHRILAVSLRNTTPTWTQVTNKMIADRAVNGRTLASSPIDNAILSVNKHGDDPSWTKVTTELLAENIIKSKHISEGAIAKEHLQEKIIESKHIADMGINSDKIEDGAIKGNHIFTSPIPNRVLAVSAPYENPDWKQVTTDMIEDGAISREKIFTSNYPYHVLGATQAGLPPEYLQITHQFIVDDTIVPSKLIKNFTLYGTPELTISPNDDADNHQIPDTKWVRKVVTNTIKDFNPDILLDSITPDMFQDHSIDGSKLFTHPEGPRVLGITGPNEDVEFILVEEDLLSDGAVTTNKLQRSIHLLGSPVVEVRPSPLASDAQGGGQLVPDCQWVLDRVNSSISYIMDILNIPKEMCDGKVFFNWHVDGKGDTTSDRDEINKLTINEIWNSNNVGNIDPQDNEISENTVNYAWRTDAEGPFPPDDSDIEFNFDGLLGEWSGSNGGTIIGGSGNSGGNSEIVLSPGIITTDLIAKRAITASRLFTSPTANRLLGVIAPNSDPQYIQANNEMIADRAVNGRTLFSSSIDNRVLLVNQAGSDPVWSRINKDMILDNVIGNNHLTRYCIKTENIVDRSITENKLIDSPIITTNRIFDNAVTTQKINNNAVTNNKIANKSITTDKVVDDIVLPGHPTVSADNRYEVRSLRNVIISAESPFENNNIQGQNGDIWFQYY